MKKNTIAKPAGCGRFRNNALGKDNDEMFFLDARDIDTDRAGDIECEDLEYE